MSREETAAERKARLKALRAEAEATDGVSRRDASEEPPPVKFRNYVPKDDELKTARVAPVQAPAKLLDEEPEVVEPLAEADDGLDVILAAQPKKANFDLQRDIAQKLAKLDKRTQRAMFELARQEEDRRMKEGETA